VRLSLDGWSEPAITPEDVSTWKSSYHEDKKSIAEEKRKNHRVCLFAEAVANAKY
jgi:hypothetical protein